ncbi:helix-turn-helix domain-containing protein [Pedobacter caeni]|uniref:Transcriptional regulator, AraC family n=1 Tax=Pedobacter caeni TaxID=288992 RepID=A0A1M5F1K7_9SPHI|nr:helix-turn-helix domain-containing protein [Pedobacter caeni]SHF85072.1 transcriptional regulator, AraC family [Pedobacter caeni]
MEYLLTSGIVIAVFLVLLLLKKPGKTISDQILLLWLLSLGYILFCYYLIYTQKYFLFPSLVIPGICFSLLQGPFIYLYVKYQIRPINFQKTDLLHFLPFVLFNLLFLDFFFFSYENKIQIIEDRLIGYEVRQSIKLAGIYLSGLVYFPLSLMRLIRFKKNQKEEFSNIEKINFNWLLYQIMCLCMVWIVIIFIQDDRFIFAFGAVFVIWLGYFGISQVNVFKKQDIIAEKTEELLKGKTGNAGQIEVNESLTKIYDNLIILLDEDKPYLNPELKLLDLAKMLNIHPNLLSRVINEIAQKKFYELINEKRVEDFLKKLRKGDHKTYTIMALAYDSGFNSKASFNRNFKSITGMAPTEYMSQRM